MGASSAVITRDMYNEMKRHVMGVLQAGVPVVDADVNDTAVSFYTQIRRLIANSVGDGARGVAFEIKQPTIATPNDFLIRGGVLEDEGPEQLFVKGHQTQLQADETYLAGVETAPVSTAIVGSQLIDSAGNYVPGELIGRILVPDLSSPGNTYVITGNTATTITVVGGPITGTAAGDRYRVQLTTPGANRNDLVLLDVYLDEIDSAEDPDLLHVVDGVPIESMRRKRLIERVLVKEGITLPVALASGFVDADGNRHVQTPLALIARPAGDPSITDSMITDLRRKIFRLDEIDDRFVNASGDVMTGPLVMEADIIMASGAKVTGLCVIDGNALCPEVVEQRHFTRESHLLGDGDAVPSQSQVLNPLSLDHFKVHDNRYYTRSEIDARIGSNLLGNANFEDGLDGWEHAAPHPLSGSPEAEAARCVHVYPGLCGARCGGDACGCRNLKLRVEPCCRVCSFCVLRQEAAGIVCGGIFSIIQTLCVTKGNECVIPYVVLDLYASCQFVGSKTVRLYDPTPEKCGVTKEDGFVRLSRRVQVANCVDRIVVTVCYEIVPREVPLETYGVYYCTGATAQVGLAPRCEVGPEGLEWEVCAIQIRKVGGLEGAIDVPDPCRNNPIPMLERCHPDGRVEFTPGAGQVGTIIEKLEAHTEDIDGNPVPVPPDPDGPCSFADTFEECFTGLAGPVPAGVWTPGSQGPIGTSSFDGDTLVQTAAGNTFAQAEAPLPGPPPVVDVTLQFRLQEAPAGPGFRVYDLTLTGADGKTKVNVSLQGASVLVRVGSPDPMPGYTGTWVPSPGSWRHVHLSVDGAGVPTLWIDGLPIVLTSAGLVMAVAGYTPNVVSVQTNGAGPAQPAITAKYDWVFVHGAATVPTVVFCCPEGGPSV